MDRGERRWFVNRHGQTFATIDGPVEFRIGSPPTEPKRSHLGNSAPRDHPARLAMAAKELTVEQYHPPPDRPPDCGLDWTCPPC